MKFKVLENEMQECAMKSPEATQDNSTRGDNTQREPADTSQEKQLSSLSSSTQLFSSGIISQHLKTLEHLDKQYQHMLGIEQSIEQHLEELQKEEQSLRKALAQSSTTLREQRQSENQQKEAAALARLEDALMNDDDSDSSSSS